VLVACSIALLVARPAAASVDGHRAAGMDKVDRQPRPDDLSGVLGKMPFITGMRNRAASST